MKKITLILCFLLFISGCTKTVTVIEMPTLPEFSTGELAPFENPTGKVVTQPDTKSYWFDNGQLLSYEKNNSVSTQVTVNQQYLTIDGLIDETVEQKINQALFAASEEFRKYIAFAQAPSYHGIFKQYPEARNRVNSINISSWPTFTYDNLLSVKTKVCVFTNKSNEQNDYGCGSYGVSKFQNFDLKTGEEINLSDLFVSGSDFVTRLNELITMDIQANIDFETGDYYQVSPYTYLGGFSGIRGDIQFGLSYDALLLNFDESYPEFFNHYGPTQIGIPWTELKDILAFQQRFDSEKSLFTTPLTSKVENYLGDNVYVDPRVITVEKRDKTTINTFINRDKTLNATFNAITDRIFADDQKKIDAAVKNKAVTVTYKVSAIAYGPYLNIDRMFYDGTSLDYFRMTYKPDGSPLTFSDVFRAGFDYKSLIIAKMKAIATEYQFSEVYDYEAIFKTMNVMVTNYSDGVCAVHVFNKFHKAPALDEGTFDVTLILSDYPNDILIKDWAN